MPRFLFSSLSQNSLKLMHPSALSLTLLFALIPFASRPLFNLARWLTAVNTGNGDAPVLPMSYCAAPLAIGSLWRLVRLGAALTRRMERMRGVRVEGAKGSENLGSGVGRLKEHEDGDRC
ncbi:uncharacterized protein BDZ99DRAFT_244820 [Mytilinidion resinicola]|uniref:Uncharacterized protein n=1 Tax=Mytilinidion resinicola TaxID=574789 RepID=A0A6A6YWZ8_9PEZI|nr:uncharacterized protein BDZ99DRAFT_244820 [Mytilinidion resinicola]KAF2812923.1 hypothetical protein BDZ99DRAFT_244820 [Mytilinidion resinicola]